MRITCILLLSLAALLGLAGCHREATEAPAPALVVPVRLALGAGTLTLNPSGYAPLAAELAFTAPQAGRVRLVVRGRHGAESDVVQQFADQGTAHDVPVLGLYPDYANQVLVQLVNPAGQVLADTTLTVQTAPLPPNMPTTTATERPGARLGAEFSLVSNFSTMDPMMPLMLDNYGDIRWLLDYRTHPELSRLTYDCGINRLQNGNFYFGDETTSRLYEVDVYGNVLNRWDLPGYTFHHEMYEKPNGNFLVSVSKLGSTHTDGSSATSEDYVVEVDRHANQLVQVWDLKQSLDEYRHALEPDPVDWLHVNALLYDASDNTIIVSGRYQGVVKLTYANRVVWLLAPHRGWGHNHQGQNLNNYLLTPLGAGGQAIADTAVASGGANAPSFEWNWYQHSIQLLPNGNLLLFDNGTNRNFVHGAATHYSRAVEFRIDPAARTVRQVWSYGEAQGAATYSAIVSRVQYLPAVNHLMFCPGYQVPTSGGLGGKIIELDYATKKPLLEIELTAANTWGFHRAQRLELYPE